MTVFERSSYLRRLRTQQKKGSEMASWVSPSQPSLPTLPTLPTLPPLPFPGCGVSVFFFQFENESGSCIPHVYERNRLSLPGSPRSQLLAMRTRTQVKTPERTSSHITDARLLSGQGAVGEVWEAKYDGKPAIVKVMPNNSETAREVSITQQLSDMPHRVGPRVYSIFKGRNSVVLVMERLDGSLTEWLRTSPGRAERRAALDEIRRLFQTLHGYKLYHADVHTGNIMHTGGPPLQWYLIDFGWTHGSGKLFPPLGWVDYSQIGKAGTNDSLLGRWLRDTLRLPRSRSATIPGECKLTFRRADARNFSGGPPRPKTARFL